MSRQSNNYKRAAAAAAGAGSGVGLRRSQRIAAAAAAAAAVSMQDDASNTGVAPGGKRKGTRAGNPPGPKRRRATTQMDQKADATRAYALEAALYSEEAARSVLTAWVDTQLIDANDAAPDDAEALRREILALPSRPIRGQHRRAVLTMSDSEFERTPIFSTTLTLPSTSQECLKQMLHLNELTGSPEVVDMVVVRELSLLLRLYVALGGDLNTPVVQFYGTNSAVAKVTLDDDPRIKQLEADYFRASANSTLGACLLTDANSVAALVLAGRRVRFNWAVHATTRPDMAFAAVTVAIGVLSSAGVRTSHGNPDFRPLQQRLMHVAGEDGIFLSARTTRSASCDHVFSWQGDWGCAWLHARFAEFEHDDHSQYLYPEHFRNQDWCSRVNRRRKAFRREFPAHVGETSKLIPPLCAIVAEYVFDPMPTCPVQFSAPLFIARP